MKKIICLLTALTLAVAVLFAGCGKAAKIESSYGMENGSEEFPGDMAYDEVSKSSEEAFGLTADSLSSKTPLARKIIQNASVDVQTDDSLALYKSLAEWAQANGGYEDSKNQFKSGDATVVEATLKLPPEQVEAFLDFVAQSGEVINCSTESQDITDSYYDVQTRLESKRKSLQSYYELLNRASTVEEIGTVQSYINQITEEIEALTGRIKMWDSQVSYASVRVYIREYTDAVKIKKDISWNTLTFDDMLYMMKSGFLGAVNFLASALQWLLIAVIAVIPILLPIAIVIFLLRRRRKKKKAAQAALNGEEQKKD